MATSKKLKLKLLLDNEKKKVIFAESDKDFVDILFSFLTLPLGSIIRILNKQSSLGCLDKLYESIENLDDCYFSTKACKEMLLRLLNACGLQCEDLALRVDDSYPRTSFCCRKRECYTKSSFFSSIPKIRCECGEIMDMTLHWEKKDHKGPNGDGVFVKENINFIIADDLAVMPASTLNMHNLIEKHGIKDLDNVEEACIDMDVIMLLDFLKRSLLSKNPLSDMYFQESDSIEIPEFCSKGLKIEDSLTDKESKKVKTKLFVCKSSNKVLYAEAEGDFVELLFNVLTIPLGAIVKLLDKFSSISCLDNLYKSVEKLSFDCKYIKPDASNLLLHPKLAAHFSQSDSLFSVSEASSLTCKFPVCGIQACLVKAFSDSSFRDRVGCDHGYSYKLVAAKELNPKLQSSAEVGGNYAKMETKFLITDDLQIKPFSTLCSFQTIKRCNASFVAFEEKEIDIDEVGALKLLKSCLTSKSPLSDAFLAKKQKNRLYI